MTANDPNEEVPASERKYCKFCGLLLCRVGELIGFDERTGENVYRYGGSIACLNKCKTFAWMRA